MDCQNIITHRNISSLEILFQALATTILDGYMERCVPQKENKNTYRHCLGNLVGLNFCGRLLVLAVLLFEEQAAHRDVKLPGHVLAHDELVVFILVVFAGVAAQVDTLLKAREIVKGNLLSLSDQ